MVEELDINEISRKLEQAAKGETATALPHKTFYEIRRSTAAVGDDFPEDSYESYCSENPAKVKAVEKLAWRKTKLIKQAEELCSEELGKVRAIEAEMDDLRKEYDGQTRSLLKVKLEPFMSKFQDLMLAVSEKLNKTEEGQAIISQRKEVEAQPDYSWTNGDNSAPDTFGTLKEVLEIIGKLDEPKMFITSLSYGATAAPAIETVLPETYEEIVKREEEEIAKREAARKDTGTIRSFKRKDVDKQRDLEGKNSCR